MKCPNCSSEVPAQEGSCPHCGVFIVMPAGDVFATKKSALQTVPLLVLGFLAVMAVVGLRVYLFFHRSGSAPGGKYSQSKAEPAARRDLPVQHGEVVKPEELQGHGKLYFVPVGKQAIPVETLAEYYRQKFKIDVTVLPKVETRATDYIPARKQHIAELLIADMADAYPDVAWKRDSVMIALTDEDIFPLQLGWDFTYSLHSVRFGIVSTRRMDPAFWGDPPNEATRLASTKQMLTKYVALTFFHLPESFDPTSILYSPLEPDGGSDDIYESDLHPEQSANGRRGTPNPCLFFRYSYKTHKVIPHDPVLADCVYDNPAMSTDEETFTTNLAWGIMIQKGVDLELNSIPAIEFRRGYNSSRNIPLSLGVGATHSFDSYISSDDSLAQTVMSINREDEAWYYLDRMDKGRGFDAGSVYKSTEHPMYGARQTWESNHYKIQYRDGSWSTYLSCAGEHEHCYWTHYQDAKGNSFEFDRGPNRELRQIRTNDHKGIDFKFDDKSRTVRARATNGRQVFYEYDAAGCLARVHRMDGQVTLYGYRTPCRMTSMSVVRQPGAAPETVLTNELDARSRIMKQTLAGLGTYTIQYVRTVGEKNWEWRVTDPASQTWRINMNSDFYLARTGTVRFPAETRQ